MKRLELQLRSGETFTVDRDKSYVLNHGVVLKIGADKIHYPWQSIQMVREYNEKEERFI